MIGHTWARDLLARAAERNRLGHSYLLVGPESVGKTSLALHLGGLLVCTGAGCRPCGDCRGCRRLIRGLHPDVVIVRRDAERRDITIEQIRQVEQDISLRPYEASQKLFCIAGADRMNDSAASALLKTLEEPPPNATVVLTAEDPMALPATVRSRCQTLTLEPVPSRVIADALATDFGADRDTAASLAGLARGRPGWAVTALTDPAQVERERAALALIGGLAFAGPYSRMQAVESWLGRGAFVEVRERALGLLARLEVWWRDALLDVASSEALELARHQLVGVSVQGVGVRDIIPFLTRIQVATYQVQANVMPRLALDGLLSAMPLAGNGANA